MNINISIKAPLKRAYKLASPKSTFWLDQMKSAKVPRRKPIASVLSQDRRRLAIGNWRLATGNFQLTELEELAELSQVPSAANCGAEVAEMSLGTT